MSSFNSGLKKQIKKDPVAMSVFRHSPDIQNAVFIYGKTGSGKTTSLLSFAQVYRDNPARQYKIFDIWGGLRNEQLYWTLPSNKQSYWKNAKKVLKLTHLGIKQYKVNLLYPLFGKIPKQLPFNPPYVFSKVFTIPFSDMELIDFSMVVGKLSNTNESMWNEVKHKIDKKTTVPEFLKKLEKIDGKRNVLYKNIIAPLTRELFIQTDDCIFNIDLKKELYDKEVISVLCLDHVPIEYKMMIMNYILRKMADLLDNRRVHTLVLIREAGDFFRVTDISIAPDRNKVFKIELSKYIRMGRRGMHMICDTQSPSESRAICDGQQDMTLLGKMPGEKDRAEATDQLFRDNLITDKQRREIASLEPGQFIVCPSGKKAFFQYFLLPKTRFWEEGNGDFYQYIWKNSINRWTTFTEEINQLKEKLKNEHQKIIDKENERKQNLEFKKELDKKIKEENDFIEKQNKLERARRLKLKYKEKIKKITKPVVKPAVKPNLKPITNINKEINIVKIRKEPNEYKKIELEMDEMLNEQKPINDIEWGDDDDIY